MSGLIVVVVVVAGYAIGTFPTALLVGKRLGFDPTSAGSGNPGTSNAMRVGGRRAGIVVLVGDLGKGALAAGLGLAVHGYPLAWAAGAAAVAGHMWPATRNFRGGKGVATAAGVGVVCFPLAMVGLSVLFALSAWLTGRAAVGSLAAVSTMPVIMAVTGRPGIEVAIAAITAVAVVVRHRANLEEIHRMGLVKGKGSTTTN